jgi:retron-type reverse transcriptase
MAGGIRQPTVEGTPQGSPLSPILSNIMLDDLDQELGKRGHRFVRYADLCRARHKSAYAEPWIMPTWLLDALVSGRFAVSGSA